MRRTEIRKLVEQALVRASDQSWLASVVGRDR
jgi:hypothetical protein